MSEQPLIQVEAAPTLQTDIPADEIVGIILEYDRRATEDEEDV